MRLPEPIINAGTGTLNAIIGTLNNAVTGTLNRGRLVPKPLSAFYTIVNANNAKALKLSQHKHHETPYCAARLCDALAAQYGGHCAAQTGSSAI